MVPNSGKTNGEPFTNPTNSTQLSLELHRKLRQGLLKVLGRVLNHVLVKVEARISSRLIVHRPSRAEPRHRVLGRKSRDVVIVFVTRVLESRRSVKARTGPESSDGTVDRSTLVCGGDNLSQHGQRAATLVITDDEQKDEKRGLTPRRARLAKHSVGEVARDVLGPLGDALLLDRNRLDVLALHLGEHRDEVVDLGLEDEHEIASSCSGSWAIDQKVVRVVLSYSKRHVGSWPLLPEVLDVGAVATDDRNARAVSAIETGSADDGVVVTVYTVFSCDSSFGDASDAAGAEVDLQKRLW